MLLPLYLRHEPTTDRTALQFPEPGRPRRDVVAYADEACTVPKGRWPWWASYAPRRRDTRVNLNCFWWRAVWLPDSPVRSRERVHPVAPNGLVLLYLGAS
jgi:hypothetical protein